MAKELFVGPFPPCNACASLMEINLLLCCREAIQQYKGWGAFGRSGHYDCVLGVIKTGKLAHTRGYEPALSSTAYVQEDTRPA